MAGRWSRISLRCIRATNLPPASLAGSTPLANLVTIMLDNAFGHVVNGKGYRVLNHVRVIYGDGINRRSIRDILANLKINGYAADNIAFGMGGALLQQVNRDTQRMAMKTSAILLPDGWHEVYKAPATDPGKASKKGILSTFRSRLTGEYLTLRTDQARIDSEWEKSLPTSGGMASCWCGA